MKSFLSSRWMPALALLGCLSGNAGAATQSLRDYFAALGPNYPVQSLQNDWTFHDGTHTGSLIAPMGANYRDPVSVQQIGALVDVGSSGCTSGFCPADVATTLATFNGVFVHPGSSSPISAVFHAHEALQLDELRLWSETVGNGNNGNGFDVVVRAIINGVSQNIGSFTFDYASTSTAKDEHVFAPGLILQAGDLVEFVFGNRGSYLYDHGNVEVRLSASAVGDPGGNDVPEPATALLVPVALVALRLAGRGRRARAS